jgi:hypothetical protein
MSEMESFQSEYTRKFADDADAQTTLANTRRLADVKSSDYDAVFDLGLYSISQRMRTPLR